MTTRKVILLKNDFKEVLHVKQFRTKAFMKVLFTQEISCGSKQEEGVKLQV